MRISSLPTRICGGVILLSLTSCTAPRVDITEPGSAVRLEAVPSYNTTRLPPESAVIQMVRDYWHPPAPPRWWQRRKPPVDLQLSQSDLLELVPHLRALLVEDRLWPHWQEGRLQDLLDRIDRQVPPIALLQPHPIDPAQRYPVLITGYDLSTQTLRLQGTGRRPIDRPIDDFLIEWRHAFFLYLTIVPPERASWLLSDNERAGRGRFFRERGEYDAAQADLSAALQQQPNRAELWIERGDTDWAAGNSMAAIEHYRHALLLMPNQTRAANNLAWALLQTGEAEDALFWSRQAVALQPDHPRYLHTLGWTHYQLGQYPEAIRHLQRARARAQHLPAPERATIARNLALIYVAADTPHLARQTLRDALSEDPQVDVPPALRPFMH